MGSDPVFVEGMKHDLINALIYASRNLSLFTPQESIAICNCLLAFDLTRYSRVETYKELVTKLKKFEDTFKEMKNVQAPEGSQKGPL
jgi:hypothetical protein